MTPLELVHRVREHHVDQYQVFAHSMFEEFGVGAAEVQFHGQEWGALHRQRMRSDFAAKKDDHLFVRMFVPDLVLEFPPFQLPVGSGTSAIVEALRWDNAEIDHGLPALPEGAVDAWFDQHFDPSDSRYDEARRFGSYVHSLAIEPGRLSVDFGSAPVEALTDLLGLLAQAGARTIVVRLPRAPT
jgi:hypothetical protein